MDYTQFYPFGRIVFYIYSLVVSYLCSSIHLRALTNASIHGVTSS